MENLEEKLDWLNWLNKFVAKAIVIYRNFEAADKKINVEYPNENSGKAGTTKEERNEFNQLLNLEFIDCCQYLYPSEKSFTFLNSLYSM